MTFPFSTHNYQLRFWMAAGGVDPDEDVRLVVLPPPYMVESLANGHVDALLRRRAVEFGRGRSRHRPHPAFRLGNPAARGGEGAGGARAAGLRKIRTRCAAWCGRIGRAAAFVEDRDNRDEVAAILAAPEPHRRRARGDPAHARRPHEGRAGCGTVRSSDRYLLVGREGAARPDPVQAAWLYAQMVRWGQAPLSAELLATAKAVFRPDLYDAPVLGAETDLSGEPADGIGAFAGPAFDPQDITRALESVRHQALLMETFAFADFLCGGTNIPHVATIDATSRAKARTLRKRSRSQHI